MAPTALLALCLLACLSRAAVVDANEQENFGLASGVQQVREQLKQEASQRCLEPRRKLTATSCGLLAPDFDGISTDVGYADANPIPADFYSKKAVGVLTAFLGEFTEAISVMEGVWGVKDIANKRFVAGVMDGTDIVLVTTGIGMTNAATTVQSMFNTFPAIEYVIFSGIAGGSSPHRNIADVIVPKFWVQPYSNKYVRPLVSMDNVETSAFADFGVDFPTKFARSPSGDIYTFLRPGCLRCDERPTNADFAALEAAGAVTADRMAVMIELETFTSPIDAFQAVPPSASFFYTPQVFLDIVKLIKKDIAAGKVVFQKSGIDPITGDTLYFDPKLYVGASGVSGDVFLDNKNFRSQIYKAFGAECVDMETVSLMRTCESNGKKCVGIRSLSDLAGGGGSLNQILSFISIAGKNSVVVLRAMLSHLEGTSKTTCSV